MTLKRRHVAESTRTRENQLRVLKALELEEAFKNSSYSSYGWFLRALGIIITENYMVIKPESPYFYNDRAVGLELSFGRWGK